MPLFLDRLPLHGWTDHSRTPPVAYWSVRVSVIPADAGLSVAPVNVQPQPWAIDTGFVGEAFAWRQHLLAAGLDPDAERVGTIRAMSTLGASGFFPLRNADLRLVSILDAARSDTSPERQRRDRRSPRWRLGLVSPRWRLGLGAWVRPARVEYNIPALAQTPWRLELDRGIVLRDVPTLPDPNLHRPLIGMQAMIQACPKVEIDFAHQVLSLWMP